MACSGKLAEVRSLLHLPAAASSAQVMLNFTDPI